MVSEPLPSTTIFLPSVPECPATSLTTYILPAPTVPAAGREIVTVEDPETPMKKSVAAAV